MISLITFFIMIKWEIFIRTSELFQMKSWRIFNFSLFRQPHEIMSKGGDRDLDLFTYHLELPCRNTICSVLKIEQIVQWHICLMWCNVASFKISAKNKNIDLYFCLAGKECDTSPQIAFFPDSTKLMLLSARVPKNWVSGTRKYCRTEMRFIKAKSKFKFLKKSLVTYKPIFLANFWVCHAICYTIPYG